MVAMTAFAKLILFGFGGFSIGVVVLRWMQVPQPWGGFVVDLVVGGDFGFILVYLVFN